MSCYLKWSIRKQTHSSSYRPVVSFVCQTLRMVLKMQIMPTCLPSNFPFPDPQQFCHSDLSLTFSTDWLLATGSYIKNNSPYFVYHTKTKLLSFQYYCLLFEMERSCCINFFHLRVSGGSSLQRFKFQSICQLPIDHHNTNGQSTTIKSRGFNESWLLAVCPCL